MQRLDGHWVAKRTGILEHYKGMTAHEIALFDVYCLLANKQTFYCYRTLDQLHELLGWDKKTLIKAKKGLEKIGFIETRGQTGIYIPKLIRFIDSGSSPLLGGKDSGSSPLSQNGIVEDLHRIVEEVVPDSGSSPPILEDERIDDSFLGRSKKSEISGLCKPERQILSLLKSIPTYPFQFDKDLSFIKDLLVDFPSLDLLEELKAWKTWLLDRGLRGKINYRSRIRKWLQNSIRFRKAELTIHKGEKDERDRPYKRDRTGRSSDREDGGEQIAPFSDIPPELLP